MSSAPRVSVIQMTTGDDVATNLAAAGRGLEQAAGDGAVLAVLPENFAFMGKHGGDKLAHAEPDGRGPIQDFLAATAQRLKLWIVAGTLPMAESPAGREEEAQGQGKRVLAASCVYAADGARAARYDKIHLFDAELGGQDSYKESKTIAPGTPRVVVVDTPAGRLGLSVCYDLRFPELYRRLSEQGAELLTVPSAFTVRTGAPHWHTLLKARAVENQCYVLAPGQVGKHPDGRSTWGKSFVFDAWGDTVAECGGERPEVATADVDLEKLAKLRKDFPVLSHRRL